MLSSIVLEEYVTRAPDLENDTSLHCCLRSQSDGMALQAPLDDQVNQSLGKVPRPPQDEIVMWLGNETVACFSGCTCTSDSSP